MPTDNVSEPSEGARRAAERILKSPWAYEFDGERKVSKLAQIIDSETRCGEMRKALEEIAELDAEKDSTEGWNEWGEAECFNLAKEIARNALNGGPQ